MAIAAAGRYVESSDDHSSPASSLVSDANYTFQLRLLEQLRHAREVSSLSISMVAETLNTTVEMIEDIESGDYELNLSELRQFAYAVDSIIEFRVHCRASTTLSGLKFDSSIWSRIWKTYEEPSWKAVISGKTSFTYEIERNIESNG